MAGTQASCGKTPTKSMSSRLLTMKFMQRAAASSPAHSSFSTNDDPSPKRRKTSAHSSPIATGSGLQAVQAALAEEEEKRQKALARQSEGFEETRWELSYQPRSRLSRPLRVVNTSLTSIDSSAKESREYSTGGATIDEKDAGGRRSYGQFNRTLEDDLQKSQSKLSNGQPSNSSESNNSSDDAENSSSSQDESTGDPMAMIRHEAKKQDKKDRRFRERAIKEAVASERDSKKLSKLTSISGVGSPMVSPRKANGKRSLPENQFSVRQDQRPQKRVKS
ncbi:MAG: hypothetical protein M1814_001394 [Vezdaea aestivalis]|nr:MAG: hypothetical protein M1814_001394 [Vezdaea aestivalis]